MHLGADLNVGVCPCLCPIHRAHTHTHLLTRASSELCRRCSLHFLPTCIAGHRNLLVSQHSIQAQSQRGKVTLSNSDFVASLTTVLSVAASINTFSILRSLQNKFFVCFQLSDDSGTTMAMARPVILTGALPKSWVPLSDFGFARLDFPRTPQL